MDFYFFNDNVSFQGHSGIALTLRRAHFGFVDCGITGADLVAGPGGRQILLSDPSGNLIELFQYA